MVVRPERPRSRRGGGEEREAEGSTPGPGRPDARFRWTASAGHEPASNQDGKRRWDHASCTTRSAAPRSPLSPPPVAEISSPFAQPHVADPHSSFSRSFLTFIYFYFVIVIIVIIMWWLLRSSEFRRRIILFYVTDNIVSSHVNFLLCDFWLLVKTYNLSKEVFGTHSGFQLTPFSDIRAEYNNIYRLLLLVYFY